MRNAWLAQREPVNDKRRWSLAPASSNFRRLLSHGLDLDRDLDLHHNQSQYNNMERRGAPRDNSVSDLTEMASVRPRICPQCGHAHQTRPLHSPLKLLPAELLKT